MTSVWRDNPFWIGEANWGAHGVFLDRPEKTSLAGYAADPMLPVAVLGGPRRMGKTSVLHRLEQDWRKTADSAICTIFEDVRWHCTGEPPSLQDPGRLWASLDEKLVRAGLLE